MKPNSKYRNMPKDFWADVRLIGQEVGYTERGQGVVKIPSIDEIQGAYRKLDLSSEHLADAEGHSTERGALVLGYLEYRASALNFVVERARSILGYPRPNNQPSREPYYLYTERVRTQR